MCHFNGNELFCCNSTIEYTLEPTKAIKEKKKDEK